jgi:hypothetical protein
MAFRAKFIFGPLQGDEHDRTTMAPHVPERLAFIRSSAADTHDGWMLVGTDKTGIVVGSVGAGVEEYVLDRGKSRLPSEGEPTDWPADAGAVAVYVHAPDPHRYATGLSYPPAPTRRSAASTTRHRPSRRRAALPLGAARAYARPATRERGGDIWAVQPLRSSGSYGP